MAVYTHIDKNILDEFLSEFDIGSCLSYQGITEGVENSNYMFETAQGKYILTIFEKRVNEEELPFYIGFMEHLQKNAIPCPIVIRNKKGTLSSRIQGKPAIIASFLQGAWPRETAAAHCREVGRTLAAMHNAGAKFSMKRHNTVGLPAWQSLIHACRDRADTVEEGLFEFLDTELGYLAKNAPKNMPKGAVHADLFVDNVFFEGEKLSGVIDFYFACTDVFVYDLMLALNSWCFDKKGHLDIGKSSAFLETYTSVRPLSDKEIASLPHYGRAAAIRIIATRLYDWLNPVDGALVRPKDPMEHVRILRYHQLVKNPTHYRRII